MPLARINGRLIYFAHVPKTGGSSIEAYLAQKGRVALLQASNLNWSRCTGQHIHAAIYTNLFRDGFYDFGFTVLRDPKDRLISEYKMRLDAPAKAVPRPKPTLRARVRLLINEPNVGVEAPGFDRWVRKVFAAYAKNPYVNDNHIRPQHEFVHPQHRVFLFEDGLDPVFRWIDEVTETEPGETGLHRKKAASVPVSCSLATDRAIREFYRADYDLIASLASGRA